MRSGATYRRVLTLPDTVDTDNIEAELRHGVLTMTLPKRPEVMPRKIQVR